MKFKILEVKQDGINLRVAIQHEKCIRQCFCMSINFAKDNKYIDEIKKILSEIYAVPKKIKINNDMIGKEIDD